MNTWFMCVVVCMSTIVCYADEGRRQFYFFSENGQYIFRSADSNGQQAKPTLWELYDVREKKQLYTVAGDFKSLYMVVSNDGRSLVAVNDYVENVPADSIVLISIYRDGRLIGQHKMQELVENYCHVTQTIGHFRWCLDNFQLRTDSVFSLTTYELLQYEFHMTTGMIILRRHHPCLQGDSYFVCGVIHYIGGDTYEIDIKERIYGGGNTKKLRFRSDEEKVPPQGCIVITGGIYKPDQSVPLLDGCR